MLYSEFNKVNKYLSNYNIIGVSYDKAHQDTIFTLKNINTGHSYKLDCKSPMYNILSSLGANQFANDDIFIGTDIVLRKMMFDNIVTKEQFKSNYLNTDYYKRYGTIQHEYNKKQSTEYFSYLEMKDVENLKKLSGFKDNNITGVYGNFFKLNDNTLRFMLKPINPVLTNVDKVLFAQSFVMSLNGIQYPMYFIIYTNIGSNDIMFEQSNLLVNSVTNMGTVTVNLTQLFGNKQNTLYNDMLTLNGYGSKQFIVNNIFTTAIYLNTDDGIYRFIPINYNLNFFNIIFNKMGVNYKAVDQDSTGIQQGVTYEYVNVFYNETPSNIMFNEDKIVPQTHMEHTEFLDQLMSLTITVEGEDGGSGGSLGEYFNDVLFTLDVTDFQFPIYLIYDYQEKSETISPYGNQNKVSIINNVG